MSTLLIFGYKFEVGSLGEWVAAIGTVGAVVVALFHEPLMRWWRRPKLALSIASCPPDCHKVAFNNSRPVYYFRLWVSNSGKTRAEHVQVYISNLERKGENGSFERYTRFPPMNLVWSNSPGKPEVYAAGIAPEMSRHCDLCHVPHPGPHATAVPSIYFDLEMEPAALTHIVPVGAYRANLRVAAANAAPRDYELRIELKRWYDDESTMLAKGVPLSLVAKR